MSRCKKAQWCSSKLHNSLTLDQAAFLCAGFILGTLFSSTGEVLNFCSTRYNTTGILLPTSSFFSSLCQNHSTQSNHCGKTGLAIVGTTSQGQHGESSRAQTIPEAPSSGDTAPTLDFFFFLTVPSLSCCMWDLVPWPGTEPRPPALGAQSVNHWTTREVPQFWILKAD